jgi:hypothetical protein
MQNVLEPRYEWESSRAWGKGAILQSRRADSYNTNHAHLNILLYVISQIYGSTDEGKPPKISTCGLKQFHNEFYSHVTVANDGRMYWEYARDVEVMLTYCWVLFVRWAENTRKDYGTAITGSESIKPSKPVRWSSWNLHATPRIGDTGNVAWNASQLLKCSPFYFGCA